MVNSSSTSPFTSTKRARSESLSASIPFPSRLGRPEEFAELAANIIESAYLNGTTIRLDGAVRLAPK